MREGTIAQIMNQAGYHVAHTGGCCKAWEKVLPNGGYLWICDESNDLGDKIAEPFLVGFYDSEGDTVADNGCEPCPDLNAALRWADATLATMGDKGASPRCQHRDDGRGRCIDCNAFLPNA